MAGQNLPSPRDAHAIDKLLGSPEIAAFIADLEVTRWTGRPGYSIRAMVGMALIKSIYAIPIWTRVVRLVAEHDELQRVLGCAPSLDACYRFTRKLREFPDALTTCIESVVAGLRMANPEMGRQVAIDGSDLPATPTVSDSCSTMAQSERCSQTPTRHGATARQSRPVRAWLLRLQDSCCRGRGDGTADCMASRDGAGRRVTACTSLTRHDHGSWIYHDERNP